MEKLQNPQKKIQVRFQNGNSLVTISEFPVLDSALEYAIALHRSSNIKHSVIVQEDANVICSLCLS